MKTFTFYSRYIIVLCLLVCATSKIFGQRHFATTQNNGATGLLCVGCSVTNPLNAVDANLQTFSILNVPVGLLAGTYQELVFPGGAVPANTPLTIKLGTGDNLLDITALGGVTITPYNGNVAGTSITAPTLASVASSNNQLELIFSPTTPYTKVRVTLNGGLLGALSSIYLYDAFYTTPGGQAICNTPYDELHGISSALLGLGLNVGGVANPQNAIDGNINTASTLNAGVGALGAYAQQTVVFENTSTIGDSVRITVSLPKALLDVGLLTNTLISTFNGNVDNNDAQQLNGSLLRLRLLDLSNNRQRLTVTYAPTKVFDRVQLRLGGIASVLSTLDFYGAELVIPKPVVKINNIASDTTQVCAGSGLTLVASANAPATFSWYTTATGGTPVFTGASFPVTNLNANITYYVAATRAGCPTASDRASVAVRVNQIPAVPVVANANIPVCPGATGIFTATQVAGVTVNWYSAATGGTLVFSGNTFTTPVLTATTSYYAEATTGGVCVSTTRKQVTATMSAVPAVPTLTIPNPTICNGNVAVLSIASPVATQTYNWYSVATGGTPLSTGPDFTSPALSANTTYYAEAVNAAGCVSSTRVASNVTVQPTPATPVVAAVSQTIAAGQSATINVTSPQAGLTYKWYNSATAVTPVFTGPIYVTPALFGSTTYYVAAETSGGCQSTGRAQITISVAGNSNTPCTFANQQTRSIDGVCLLCDVTNPTLAADADTTTASTFVVPVGLLGGSASQVLQFQQPGFAGDTIRIGLQSPGGLADLSLLGGITVTVLNGTTTVASYPLNSSLLTLRLLGGTGRYAAYVPATGNYDRIKITLSSGAASLLTQLNVYYAVQQFAKPKFNTAGLEICKGSSAPLSIIAPNPANGTFSWFTTPTGGTAVATGLTYNTPALTANTTYYVEYSRGTCVSPTRTPALVIVNDIPVKPAVTPTSANVIAGQTATLKATVVNNATIKWYTSATGGTPVYTGDTFTTPVLNANTTYYAEASLGSCVSPDRTAVPVTVTAIVIPDVSVNPTTQSVPAGTSATITASSTSPGTGTIFNWYTTPTGGTPVYTGPTFVTSPVFASTTYYAEAVVTATGAKSATRAAAAVNVNAIGSDPVACDAAIDQTSGVNGVCLLCGISNDGGSVDNNRNSFSQIHVPVGLLGGSAQQTLRFANAGVVGDSVIVELGYPGTLADVGLLSQIQLSTYSGTTSNGDAFSVNASLLKLTLLDGTSRFRVAFKATHNFDRVQIAFNSGVAGLLNTVNVYDATIAVAAPVVTVANSTITACPGSPVTLTATATSDATIKWYTTPTGGSPVFTGASFPITAPSIGTTIYYAEASRTATSCVQKVRTPVTVTISPVPAPPIVISPNLGVCPGGSVTFIAQVASGTTINWYATATGGTPLVTNNPSFTTPAITATTIYYAEAVAGGSCISTTRTPVTATLSPLPAVPSLVNGAPAICDGDVAVLAIANPVGGQTYNWYTAATGGTPIFTGINFTSPNVLHANTTYYAEAVNGTGCASSTRVAANVTVNPKPADPILAVNSTTVVAGQTATITVSNAQTGNTYNWYTTATGPTPVATGTPFTTPALLSNTTYYAEAVNGSGCKSARTAITINVTINNNSPCTFANQQTKTVNGVCLLCDVTNGALAVDADTTTASTLTVTAGLLNAGVSQTLQFQQPGFAGDTIKMVFQTPVSLADVSLLGSITVGVYNGTTLVATYPLSSSLLTLRLLGTGNRYAVYVPTTGAYDRVVVTLNSGAATLLTSLNVFYAIQQYPKPIFDPVAPEVCKGSTAKINITSPNPANGTFSWFTTATGGTAVATGASFTTPALTANTTYYVEYSRGTCISPVRKAVQVIVDDAPVKPIVTPPNSTITAGQTATFTATVVNNATINWYTTATGGTPVHTGPIFQTPVLSANTTYYAEAALGSCVSPDRTVVPVIVTPVVIPDVSVTPPTQTVPTGTSGTLQASSSILGTTFAWFTTPTGGTPIATGANFTTPSVFANTTYYAEATITATGVKSATRAAGVVNVSAVGTNPVPCDAAIAQTSSVNGVCLLCGVSNDAGAVDNNRESFSQIHIPVGLLGGSAQQTLRFANAGIAGDSVTVELGVPGSLLDLSVLSQIKIATYNGTTNNGDQFVVNGSLLNLTVLNGTTRFKVPFKAAHAFDRVEITFNGGLATALSSLNVYDAYQSVAAPTVSATGPIVCQGAPATLAITGTAPANVTIKWYTAATGGTLVGTGSSITIPAVTATTTYYAEASRTASNCPQAIRTPVQVTVTPAPAAPVVAVPGQPVCSGQTATFTATPVAGVTFNWYATATGGTPLLANSNTFTTPALTAPATYYVEATAGSCGSSTRTPVNATITAAPSVPVVATVPPICSGSPATLSVTTPVAGITYNWYTAATGGTLAGTGSPFTTPALTANTTYYVEAVSTGGCTSSTRAPAQVSVTPTPAAPIITTNPANGQITSGQTATLTATSAGATINWYASATGGTPVHVGSPFTTPALTSTTTYYAEAVSSTGGCISAARTSVQITVNPIFSTNCDFASSQTFDVNGGLICVGCAVNTPNNSVDQDTTNFSQLSVPIGLVGSNVSQKLIFSDAGVVGDTVTVKFTIPGSLISLGLLNQLQIASYNGTTFNNDRVNINSSLLKLTILSGGQSATVKFAPKTAFDRVEIRLNGALASVFNAVNIYYATKQVEKPTFAPNGNTVSICAGSKATFSINNSRAGVTYRWYSAAVGGTLLGTGATFTSPNVLTATTTFYVESSRTSSGCANPNRVAATANVTPAPGNPTLVNASLPVCSGLTTTFNVSPVQPGVVYSWFSTATGGTPLTTGPDFVTPQLTANATYYVEASATGCTSPSRTAANAVVNPTPVTPTVTVNPAGGAITVGQTATLTANSTTPGVTYNWYATATGGASIHTGNIYIVQPNVTTTYYVEVALSSGCVSPQRGSVTITVTQPVIIPDVAVNPATQTVPTGTPGILHASSTTPGTTFAWFTTPTGGTPIATGPDFTSPSVFAATTYYAESTVTATGVKSATRASGIINVSAIGTDPVPCDAAIAQTSSVNGVCLLCGVSNDAAAVDNNRNSFSQIHIPVGLLGGSAQQTLRFANAGIAGDSITVELGVPGSLLDLSVLSQIQIATFNGTTNNGDQFTVTSSLIKLTILNGTTRFKVPFKAAHPFDRVQITFNGGLATALSSLNVYDAYQSVASPVITGTGPIVCQGSPATLTVTSPVPANVTIRWYDAATGGNLQGTGPTLTIASVSATKTYYAEASRSVSGCPQAIRTPVTVTVTPAPAAPVASGNGPTVCSGQTATFTVNAVAGVTFNWYTTATGGTPVASGASNTFTSPPLTADVTYYVEAVAGSCGSSTRTPIKATVTTTPIVPVTAVAAPICSGSQTTVSVASPVAGVTYNWYSAATGGTLLLANSSSYTTPVLTANTTYYVEAVSGACSSTTRGSVAVTVNPTPAAPTVTINPANGQVVSGQTATLTVSPTTAGITYNWYNLPTGGTIIKTGAIFTTPALTSTTTFYVEAVSGSGCSSSARTAVKITVNPIFSTNCDFASSQTFDVSGVCLLCDVTDPNNSVDQDTTNFSQLHMPVSALGSFVNQKLIFSDPGVLGDTVTLKLSIPASLLDVNVLNSIQLASYNGTTYNGDRINLSSNLLKITILSGGQTAIVKFAPKAGFDRIEVRLNSGLATLLTTLNLYYASKQVEAPVLVTKTPAPICVGGTTTLAVANARAGVTYKWYTTAVGGTPVFTGASFPVTGVASITYYVESSRTSTNCANPNRVGVPVNVIPTPPTPALNQLTATICAGDPPVVFTITNAQAGVTYNWYDAGGILVHTGTSFPVSPVSTTTYSVEAVNGTSCTSAARTTASITVNQVPSKPGVSSANPPVCTGSSITLAVLNPEAGVTYNWYTAATGGTLAHTGLTFPTPVITAPITYYIEATNASSCINAGGRTAVTLTPTTLPVAPTLSASQNPVCNGGTVTITVTNAVAGITYNWYTVATGGTPVFTSTNPTYTTGPLTADVTYYVEAVNASTCSSATRTPIKITVLAVPPPPIVQTPAGGNSVCFGFPATLTITNPQAGVIYNWYEVATGGAPVFTSTSAVYQTPALTANKTYYVEATVTGNCTPSARTAVPVTVNPLPADPTLTSAAPSACLGSPAVLTIKTPQAGVTYNWYASATATTPVQANSPTYTTPPITAATEFFVEAISGNGCGNASGRIKITVTVTPPPAAPVIANGPTTPTCTGSGTTLTIQNPQVLLTYRWYTTATGGTPVASGSSYPTPVLTANTTYYAEAVNSSGCASSSRTAVEVDVNQLPGNPTVTAVGGKFAICAGSSAVLTATAPGATTYNWYTVATGGTSVFTGATFPTPPVTAAITYYAEAVSASGCVSNTRTPVPLTIDNTQAPDPTVDGAGLITCQNSSTTINIKNPVAGTTYNWYASSTGGTALYTGTAFLTPVLTANTTYYVEAVNSQNCSASTRVPAPVVVTSQPNAPTLTLTTAPVCRGSSTILHVQSPQAGITYNWYSDAGRTSLVFTGPDFTTPSITADITYYVEAASGTCSSATLASVNVTAIDAPAVPVVASNGNVNSCQGGTATLDILNPQGNLTYKWYNSASGGTALFTGPSFVTPVLTTNTIYYVEAVNVTGCPSASRTSATVTVTGAPVAPQASTDGTSICPGVSTTVSATSATPGATINWYADATGGAILATGTSFKTPVLSANTTYYAEAVTAGGCVSTVRTPVTVTMLTPLPAPVASVGATTMSSITFIWAPVTGATGYQVSIDNGQHFITPSSGANGLTHVVNNLQPNQNVTIIVRASGSSDCQLSANSAAVTGTATNPFGNGIFVPNVFTPNGDGNNDILLVYGNTIKSLKLSIYDQWGELQFQTTNKASGWDGTYKGTKQPVGVYVYYVEVTMNDGQLIKKKGTVTLLR